MCSLCCVIFDLVIHYATKKPCCDNVALVQSIHKIGSMEANTHRENNVLKEILKASLIALIIVIPIRVYIAQPYIVSGASMDPTFENGHYIIVDQISYRLDAPHRGDVVIFKYPKDPTKYFIKRIIGLPGETIVSNRGTVIIAESGTSTEGTVLPEPYIAPENQSLDSFKKTLNEGEYFVMGDNRNASSDSRVWGALPEGFIVGRAFVRVLPVTDIGFFPGEFVFQGF